MTEKAQPQPTRQAPSEQLREVASEVAMPRESMTTVAEWDLQARLRQQQLDQTLTTLRCGPRILVVVNLVLVGTNLGLIALVLCLLGRVGA